MADSSLDDFFAKKDKNKKSRKKYSALPEEMVMKSSEDGKEPGKPVEKAKKEKDKSASIPSGSTQKDTDDWKDYEEEKEKDYSGLKIQTLNIKDKEDEIREQKMQENGQETRKDDQSGPWKNVKPNESEPIEKPKPIVPEVKEEAQVKKTGAYMPPSMRRQLEQGGGGGMGMGSSSGGPRNKKTLQINNEAEFPSLGGAEGVGAEGLGDFKDFKVVKSGNRDTSNRNIDLPDISSENKYSILS